MLFALLLIGLIIISVMPVIIFWGLIAVFCVLIFNSRRDRQIFGLFGISLYLIWFSYYSYENYPDYRRTLEVGELYNENIESISMSSPEVVKIVYPTSYGSYNSIECESLCSELLVDTSVREVIIESPEQAGKSYRLGRGVECQQSSHAESFGVWGNSSFQVGRNIGRGAAQYVPSELGLCLIRLETSSFAEAVIYLNQFKSLLPKRASSNGESIEIYNIEKQQNQLLGRHARFSAKVVYIPPMPYRKGTDCAVFCRSSEWALQWRQLWFATKNYDPKRLLEDTLDLKLDGVIGNAFE